MCMDVIHNAISWGPQFKEIPFMDLSHSGDPIEAYDGTSNLLYSEFVCFITLVLSLQQGLHLHPILGVEFGDLL